MKETLKKIGELLETGMKEEQEARDLLIELNNLKADINKKSADLIEAENFIAERETAVKHIEDVLALKKQADEALAQVRKEKDQLETERAAFIKLRDSDKADIASEKKALALQAESLKKQSDELTQAAEQLKQEKDKVAEKMRKLNLLDN